MITNAESLFKLLETGADHKILEVGRVHSYHADVSMVIIKRDNNDVIIDSLVLYDRPFARDKGRQYRIIRLFVGGRCAR